MAMDIDDLVKQVVFDVAIAGSKGLGVEKVDNLIKNHHDHHQLSASTSQSNRADTASLDESPTSTASTWASLKTPVWQRLREHPDILFETADEDGPSQLDGGDASETLDTPDKSKSTPTWVYASEDRVWRAIAGHGVDHKRLPRLLFEILEVVAAAGPNGILQPEARRLTDQDKQSIPIRTDKLADRGYITKEKTSVPKMITSRLRLWRFANDASRPLDDSAAAANRAKDEHMDYTGCFEGMLRLLQSNDGIAVLKDIQLETDCTSQLMRKALLRCINRLEERGLLRKIKAKVQGANRIDGSDRYERCVQLLRDPNDLDRGALMGKGGPVKLDSQGRPCAKSRVRKSSEHIDPLSDSGEEQTSGDETEADETTQAQAADQYRILASDPVGPPTATRLSVPNPSVSEHTVPTTTSPNPSTPSKTTAKPASHRSATKRRHSAQRPPPTTSRALQFVPELSNVVDTVLPNSPGVYFPPVNTGKKKVGRPKKSLIAVFKTDKLREQPWLRAGLEPQPSPSSTTNAGVSAVSQNEATAPASLTATDINMTRPPAPQTPISKPMSSDPQQLPAVPGTGTLSKASLGQLKRRERERAQRAAADKQASDDRSNAADSAMRPLESNLLDDGKSSAAKLPVARPHQQSTGRASREAAAILRPENLAGPAISIAPEQDEFQFSDQDAQGSVATYSTRLARNPFLPDFFRGQAAASPLGPSGGDADPLAGPNDAASGVRLESLEAVPHLRFVAFEHTAESDPSRKWTPTKKTITRTSGEVYQERCKIVLDIVRAANGVFPGVKEMWYPFVTKWHKTSPQTPETRTVAKVIESLRRDGKLKKYAFQCRTRNGGVTTFHILLEPGIDPSAEQVRKVQKNMIDVSPDSYMPEEVELTVRMRLQGRFKSVSSQKKRTRDDDPDRQEPPKRRRRSAAQDEDVEYIDDGANEDEDEEYELEGPRKDYYEYTDRFPSATEVTVKRTAAGREYSNTEAQRNGFADAKARVLAMTQLGHKGYRDLRRDALSVGHLVGADEIRPSSRGNGIGEDEELTYQHSPNPGLQGPVVEAPKKRTGWPKGQPRGPNRSKMDRMFAKGRNEVTVLLSLLFFPQQLAHSQSGTFGTVSKKVDQVTVGSTAALTGVDGGGKTTSKKRTADEMNDEVNPAASLLMGLGQIISRPSGTFGTTSVVEPAPQVDDSGRGKRVKRATEKAVPISTYQPSEQPPALQEPKSTTKAKPYSQSSLADDPDVLVSTDYVNSHPEENWYHRGKGRWERGLPPPGASYKTAVKGPDAKAYLARIGTLEGKSKQQGPVVDGVQMTRNGEPWKRQPLTVNGVRINPVEESPKSSTPAQRSKTLTPSGAVAPVQYEVPALRPGPEYDGMTISWPTLGQQSQDNFRPPSQSIASGPVPASKPGRPPQPRPASTLQQSGSPSPLVQSQTQTAIKRKRPYTYKSRKQLSTVGPDGVPIELDRDSDDDYRQTNSPKKQKQSNQVKPMATRTKTSIDRKKLLTAIALVKKLCGTVSSKATSYEDTRWDLVALALQMSDRGVVAKAQYQSMPYYPPNVDFITAVQREMQEPFLAALEKEELPHVDHIDLDKTDWPGLLEWIEKTVVSLIPKDVLNSTKQAIAKSKTQPKKQKTKEKRPIVVAIPVFPATYNLKPQDRTFDLDLKEDLIMTKSWIRANSTTKDEAYDTAKATQKLTLLGTPIVQAVQEMQETNTIRQLKKGRQRPGRNFEITQHVWDQFSAWPGGADGSNYLRTLAETRSKLVQHFNESDTLALASGASEQETLILNGLLAQGMLKMEVSLPPRDDDIDAPFPKLNCWSYGGPRHDTRKVDRAVFDLPVVYTKTAAFSAEHSLKTEVPIPTLPPLLPNEALPRVPFWIDVHGNLLPEVWEMVLSSIIYQLVRKPGILAKGIEKAHGNKLWTWEIELALEWMEKVGVAERFGAGREIEGVWKGGWTVGEEWVCVLGEEAAGVWREG